MYLSGFKSLESLESLARLLKKVLKSCETFKIQDFANAIQNATSNLLFLFKMCISDLTFHWVSKIYFREVQLDEKKNIARCQVELEEFGLTKKRITEMKAYNVDDKC